MYNGLSGQISHEERVLCGLPIDTEHLYVRAQHDGPVKYVKASWQDKDGHC